MSSVLDPHQLPNPINGLDCLTADLATHAVAKLRGLPAESRAGLCFRPNMDARDVDLHIDEAWRANNRWPRPSGTRILAVMIMSGLDDDTGRQVANALVPASDLGEVHVFIHSPGGLIREGRQMYEALRNVGCPIYTYAMSDVDSAAMYPFMAGDVRYVDRHSSFLFHPPQANFADGASLTRTRALETARELRRDILWLAEICTRRAGIPRATISAWQYQHTRIGLQQALDVGIATAEVTSTSAQLGRLGAEVVWIGIGNRLPDRRRRFVRELERTVSGGPQWRTLLALASATLRAKFNRYRRQVLEADTPIGRLWAAIVNARRWLILGGMAVAIVWAAVWPTARQPGPYLCPNGTPDSCAAAWAVHQAFGRKDGPGVPPIGATVEIAKAGPFLIKRLRLVSGVSVDPVRDQYQVAAVLADGRTVDVFEAVVVGNNAPLTLPRISLAAWRTSGDYSNSLKEAATRGVELQGDARPVDPGAQDLRLEAQVREAIGFIPGLAVDPPSPVPAVGGR